jgi:hypothetical protein
MHGWANYFRHAVAKDTFSVLDNFAWRRVIRMLMERHRWTLRITAGIARTGPGTCGHRTQETPPLLR